MAGWQFWPGFAVRSSSLLPARAAAQPVKVRRIAGLEAIEEAVGRATEMGRSCLFIPGIQDLNEMQTMAGLNMLSRVAKVAAEYDAKIEIPTSRSLVMTAARETVQAAYLAAGRPDSYVEDLIYYVTDEQFGYVAYLTGKMVREKPAACFYMGAFFAESLMLAETGNSIGAIQIAGTAEPAQLPFFVAACDYTLIGEEFFAASAYLSGDPDQLGSLQGQDVGKVVVGTLIIVGSLLATVAVAAKWSPHRHCACGAANNRRLPAEHGPEIERRRGMKRTVPLLITALVGIVLIASRFIPFAQSWGEVAQRSGSTFWPRSPLCSAAAACSSCSCDKISDRTPGWGYSAITLIAFFVMLFVRTGESRLAAGHSARILRTIVRSAGCRRSAAKHRCPRSRFDSQREPTGQQLPLSVKRQLSEENGQLVFRGWMTSRQESELSEFKDSLPWQCTVAKTVRGEPAEAAAQRESRVSRRPLGPERPRCDERRTSRCLLEPRRGRTLE